MCCFLFGSEAIQLLLCLINQSVQLPKKKVTKSILSNFFSYIDIFAWDVTRTIFCKTFWANMSENNDKQLIILRVSLHILCYIALSKRVSKTFKNTTYMENKILGYTKTKLIKWSNPQETSGVIGIKSYFSTVQ